MLLDRCHFPCLLPQPFSSFLYPCVLSLACIIVSMDYLCGVEVVIVVCTVYVLGDQVGWLREISREEWVI